MSKSNPTAMSLITSRAQAPEHRLGQVRALNQLAVSRGQSLAQMALGWVLRDNRMTSALIGASRVEQIEQNVAALSNLKFSTEELRRIDEVLAGKPAMA